MKFENTEVWGFKHALRGMRNPLQSHSKSDSFNCFQGDGNCEKCRFYTKDEENFGIDEGCLKGEEFDKNENVFVIGKNDLELAQNLIKAGSEHRKFLREIFIQTEIEANVYEWLKMENRFMDKSDLPDNFEDMQGIKRLVSMNYEVAYSTKHKYGKDYDNWLKTLPYSNELIFIGDENDK